MDGAPVRRREVLVDGLLDSDQATSGGALGVCVSRLISLARCGRGESTFFGYAS